MSLLVVEINDQLLKDFRRYAVNKSGKIYGVLKPEVELALRNHLLSGIKGISSIRDDNK